MNWNSGDKNQFGSEGYDQIDQYGDRRLYHSYSDDDGLTWSAPDDLTSTLTPTSYIWDAVGPGVGIQKQRSPNKGRLVVPAIGRNLYSDDGGISWNYQLVGINTGTSEGTIVEELDGGLMRNDRAVRSTWLTSKRRWISRSEDGVNWSDYAPHNTPNNALLDPRCQASIMEYNADYPHRLVFLNPSSTVSRSKMRVRLSYDDGATWPVERLLPTSDNGTIQLGGYSSIAKTNDHHIAALVESNDNASSKTSNRSIIFYKYNIPWILNGEPEPI